MSYIINKPLGQEPNPEYGYTYEISKLPKSVFLGLPETIRQRFCNHARRHAYDPLGNHIRRFKCRDCGKETTERWHYA